MRIEIINAASDFKIENIYMEAGELSVALLCKYIKTNNAKYKIISSEMSIHEHAETFVEMYVEVL